jgi:hypothetical protein
VFIKEGFVTRRIGLDLPFANQQFRQFGKFGYCFSPFALSGSSPAQRPCRHPGEPEIDRRGLQFIRKTQTMRKV